MELQHKSFNNQQQPQCSYPSTSTSSTSKQLPNSSNNKQGGGQIFNGIIQNNNSNNKVGGAGSPNIFKVEWVNGWKLITHKHYDRRKSSLRSDGICIEFPELNVISVMDPRRYRFRITPDLDLKVPNFKIDENYYAIPPKREIAITGLNDNVDSSFLRNLCGKNVVTNEIVVYYHPVTRKHLGLALIDFECSKEAENFINKHNGKTIMGNRVLCYFDPLAYKLGKIYNEMTQWKIELPARYSSIKDNLDIIRRLQFLLQQDYSDNREGDDSEKDVIPLNNSPDVFIIETPPTKISNNSSSSWNNPSKITTPVNVVVEQQQSQQQQNHFTVIQPTSKSYNSQKFLPEFEEEEKESKNSMDFVVDSEKSNKIDRFSPLSQIHHHYHHKTSSSPQKRKIVKKSHQNGHRNFHWSSSSSADSNSEKEEDNNEKNTSSPIINKHKMKKKKFSNKDNTSPIISRNSNNNINNRSGEISSNSNNNNNAFLHYNNNKNINLSSIPRPPSSPISFCRGGESTSSMYTTPTTITITNQIFNSKIQSPAVSSTCSPTTTTTILGFGQRAANIPPPGLLLNPPSPFVVQQQQQINGCSNNNNSFLPFKIANNNNKNSLSITTNHEQQQQNLEQRLAKIFGGKKSIAPFDVNVNINIEPSDENFINANKDSTFPTTTMLTNNCCYNKLELLFEKDMENFQQKLPQNCYSNYKNSYSMNGFRTYHPYPANNNMTATTTMSKEQLQAIRDEQIKVERQEQFLKCMDISKRVRSILNVDLKIMINKDIQRRLQLDAFTLLDEEVKIFEEEQKKRDAENLAINGTTTNKPSPIKPESMLLNILEDTVNDSIFGIAYSERRAFLPHFKKKKQPEFVKPTKISSSIRAKHKQQIVTEKNGFEKENLMKISVVEQQQVSRILPIVKNEFEESTFPSTSFPSPSCCIVKEEDHRGDDDNNDDELTTAAEISGLVNKQQNEIVKDEIVDETNDDEIQENIPPSPTMTKDDYDDDELFSVMESSPLHPPPIVVVVENLKKDSLVEIVEDDENIPLKDFQQTTNEVFIKQQQQQKLIINENNEEEEEEAKPTTKNFKLSSILDRNFIYSKFPPFVESSSSLPTAKKPIPKEWPRRTDADETNILFGFEKDGLNLEDLNYLKMATLKLEDYFKNYLPEGRSLAWIPPKIIKEPLQWSSPIKFDSYEFYYDDVDLEGIVPHKSGCARTEGYYKVSKQRKSLMRRHENFDGRTIISTQDETAVRHMTQASKDERAMNRRLMTFIGDNTLIRVNQLKYRSKMIKFARSRIHGWGLYALQTITPEEMIIEYVGEKVRPTVADEREKKYERRGMGSSYMFRIDGDAVIDATKQGNFGRFINHSCMPNCTARVVTVDGDKRIVIYSKRLIQKGEEITYDYKFAREEEASKIECLCGSKTCQKTLN